MVNSGRSHTATTLTTDEGQTLHLELDPPVAVATAAKEAVRRMRWPEADSILPGLVPTTPDTDTDHTNSHSRIVLVPCMAGLAPLLNFGRHSRGHVAQQMQGRSCASVCGGQGFKLGRRLFLPSALMTTDANCAWLRSAPLSTGVSSLQLDLLMAGAVQA